MKIFKPSTLVSLAIAIAAALVTQQVRATAVNNIVITENSNSSTGLTATYNGSPVAVTFVTADSWNITFPSTVIFNGDAIDWVEPENASLGNAVRFLTSIPTVTVLSDASTNFLAESNGATVTNVGGDTSNGGTINATFFDNGDVAAAPDSGSTLGLLSLAVVALLGATRLRFLQLAA